MQAPVGHFNIIPKDHGHILTTSFLECESQKRNAIHMRLANAYFVDTAVQVL